MTRQRFSFRETKGGRVQLSSFGRIVVTLTGNDAVRFLSRMDSCDPDAAQLLMAKATGQFKFGNEKASKRRTKGRTT